FSTHISTSDPKKWPVQSRKRSPIRWSPEDDSLSSSSLSLEDVDLIDLREPWIVEAAELPRAKGRHLTGRTVVLLPDPELFTSDPEVAEVEQSVINGFVHRTHPLFVSATKVAYLEAEKLNIGNELHY
ncbi:hypothetical protein P879_00651, partial [Paragonimus westermani]